MGDKPLRRSRNRKATPRVRKERNHDLQSDLDPRGQRGYADTPPAQVQEEADGWVSQGVQQLAKTAPHDEHVVLMAASYEKSGRVGAASSIRTDAMGAMRALGRLVGEVNESFIRDNVRIRVELRMREVEAPSSATERGLITKRPFRPADHMIKAPYRPDAE